MEEQTSKRYQWVIPVVILGVLLACALGTLMGAFTGALAGSAAARRALRVQPAPPAIDRLPAPALPEWPDELEIPRGLRAGALVLEVNPGSPAEEAGLRPGDIITSINGAALRPGEALADRIVDDYAPGDVIEVGFLRAGRERTVTMRLGRHPADPERPWLGITYRDVAPRGR